MKLLSMFQLIRSGKETQLKFSIVMEYADGGDVYQIIKKHQKDGTRIPEEQAWKIFIDSIKGLQTLHQLKLMHRDLKVSSCPNNQECKYLSDQHVDSQTWRLKCI